MSEGGVTTGSIVRSLTALSLDTIEANEARQYRDWLEAPDEYDEQHILRLGFTLYDKPITAHVSIGFDVAFNNPVERGSGLGVPIFTYGFQHASGTPVLLSAMVTNWSGVDAGITGASVAVTAFHPLRKDRKAVRWRGFLHANFQGYAMAIPSPDEDPTEDVE